MGRGQHVFMLKEFLALFCPHKFQKPFVFFFFFHKNAHETNFAAMVKPRRFPYSPDGFHYRAIGSPYKTSFATCLLLGSEPRLVIASGKQISTLCGSYRLAAVMPFAMKNVQICFYWNC